MLWRARGFAPSTSDELEIAGSDYVACLYDGVSAAPVSVARFDFPADASCGRRDCWSGRRSARIFRDRSGAGLLELRIRASRNGRVTASVRALRAAVPRLPEIAESVFAQDTEIIAQVERVGGGCWQSRFAAPAQRSDADWFYDRER